MHAGLRSVLDRFRVGLAPVDADFGRHKPPAKRHDPRPSATPDRAEPPPRPDEKEWIPRTILYGPPL